MLKKLTALLALLLLSGCVSQSNQPKTITKLKLNVEETLNHQSFSYQLKNTQELGTLTRYVYVPTKGNKRNLQQRVEILHDFDLPLMSIQQRISLRHKAYQSPNVLYFNLSERDQNLYAVVVYAPTEKQANWQLDIARGAESKQCGFVQYQHSSKIVKTAKFERMSKQQLISYFKDKFIDKQLDYLANLPLNWHCQSLE